MPYKVFEKLLIIILKKIMENIFKLVSIVNVDIKMSHICNGQIKHDNVSFHSAEEYSKVSIYIYHFLDHLISQLILTYDFGVIFGRPLPWEISG
jgi:hypothetical protein